MASKLIVDFIGMCVFIQPPPAPSEPDTRVDKVGLLRERRHVHMITYREPSVGDPPPSSDSPCQHLTDLAVVRGLLPGRYAFDGLDTVPAMINECDPHPDDPDHPDGRRLPDLEYAAQVTLKSKDHVDNEMAVLLTLPGGHLYPQAPIDPGAELYWVFPGLKPLHLTDRTRLEVDLQSSPPYLLLRRTSDDHPIRISPESISPDGNVYRIVIAAIDQDLGTREEKPTNGYVLEEFQLFYALTDESGPSPYYLKTHADPDSPICPQVRVQPRPKATITKR